MVLGCGGLEGWATGGETYGRTFCCGCGIENGVLEVWWVRGEGVDLEFELLI
jgi:hypothetical protein